MKNQRVMKSINLLGILLLLLFITSCNKEDVEPITLHYVENNSIEMVYPNTDNHSISIKGGDGKYSASCNNVSVVEVELVQEKKMILLKPRSIGDAIVTITDESGNLYALNVKVHYSELNLIIDKQDVIVIGDKLSAIQKSEIEQKAIFTFPVKVSGGYKFIYNNDKDIDKGQVFIYRENYDINATESVFEIKQTEIDLNGVKQQYRTYVIVIDGTQREFVQTQYVAPNTKMSVKIPMALCEVLTDQFKAEYPDVEFVYTQQRIK